jgi:DNA-binding IclR family transcriptional regulator
VIAEGDVRNPPPRLLRGLSKTFGVVTVMANRALWPDAEGSDMSNSDDGRSVTSKLAAIIRTFSTGNTHSLSHVARSAGLPISTAHRLIAELVEWGFLERADGKNYRVGRLLTQIGNQIWREPNVLEHARRVLDDLSSATRATVRLGMFKGSSVSYIEQRPDSTTVPAAFKDVVLPAHATAMGKALLAFSPADTVNGIIEAGLDQYTPFTIVTANALRRELAVIRMSQVASTHQEFSLNTAAIAVPVFVVGGRVVAALELTVNGAGYQVHAFRPAVVVAARGLSRQLVASQCRNQFVDSRSQILGRQPLARDWMVGQEGGSSEPVSASRSA